MKEFQPGHGFTEDDWNSVDSPELTDADLASARPFSEALPEVAAGIRRRGPAKTKEAVSIRLDFDIVQKLRATGPGWQSRVNEVLRKALNLAA